MAIGQYFGGESARGVDRAASRVCCRWSGCTPPWTATRSSAARARSRSSSRCRAARLPCAGVDGRRRRADAPPPRRAARDDARPARRRARARRADRGALGLGGDDLRALRLRASASCAGEVVDPARVVRRSRAPLEPRGTVRLVDRGGGARGVPAGVGRACAGSGRACPARARALVGRALRCRIRRDGSRHPAASSLLELDGEPQGYAVYRATLSWSEGSTASTLDGRRGARRRRPQATAAIWRFLLDVDWTRRSTRVAAAARPPALPPARPAAARRATGWATASGCVSSTWAPRSPAGRTRRTASSSSTCATRSARGTRAAGVSRAARRPAPTRAPDLALDVDGARLGVPRRRPVQPPARGRQGGGAAPRRGGRAERLFSWHPLPWCPEIF